MTDVLATGGAPGTTPRRPTAFWRDLPKPVQWGLMAALLVGLILLPIAKPVIITTPGSDFSSVLFTCGVYCLAALGLNVVVGFAGLLDLGYVGFFAVGAYSVAVFGSPQSKLGHQFPWLACIPIAIALSMLAGVILGGPTLRLRGDYLAIVTLGFGEIVRLVAVNDQSGYLNGQSGIASVPPPPGTRVDDTPVFGLLDAKPWYWLVLGVIVVVLLGVTALERSRVGRAWLAIREDEDAAELMGVPTFRFKLWAFAIGAALGGLSGMLFASKQAFINSDSFPVLLSQIFLAAVIIGGSGNKYGAILGGFLVAYLPERLRTIDNQLLVAYFVIAAGFLALYLYRQRSAVLSTWKKPVILVLVAAAVVALPFYLRDNPDRVGEARFLFFGVALILMSIFRPQGLLPSRRRAVELADRKKEAEVGVNA